MAPDTLASNLITPTAQAQERFTYRGDALRAVTLPLGGVGAGSIALAGDGGLRQWQIMNNVNHNGHVPNSFFAIWAGTRRDLHRNAVVLQCPALYEDQGFVPAPAISDHLIPEASRDLLAVLPGVDDLHISARHPIAEVVYASSRIPAQVTLEAFSPFVPLNSMDSGLPVIIFNFSVYNPTNTPLRISLLAAQQNPIGWDGKTAIHDTANLGYGGNVNQFIPLQGMPTVHMTNSRLETDHSHNGQLALAALSQPGDETSALLRWSRPDELWQHFTSNYGRLPSQMAFGASPEGQTWNAALAVHFTLQPGEERTIPFLLAWHFPNRYVTWHQDIEPYQLGIPDRKTRFWLGNQYSNWFDSVLATLEYVRNEYGRLCTQTRRFRDRLYASTLPWSVVESASAPVSTLHTPTCLWTEDGRFHGFEGCHGASTTHGAYDGCCPMDCTHVWNYEMALAKLFPDLEQGMRITDLVDQISPWGSIPHRTVLPLYLRRAWTDFIGGPRNPAMDGELGTVLKTYREVRHGAPREWFDQVWPAVKRVMAHIMQDYDDQGDGVIRGEQPNTYDISIYGPNTFIGSLYLAALRAAEEMARLQGESELATSYRDRYELGHVNYDRICWNGEYYIQIVDLEQYQEMQFGTGCHLDQLLGQWWAFTLDLGYILPEEHVRTALNSIYRNNRRETFRRAEQRPRVYLDERDRGLFICTWPHGSKPEQPTLYSDEVWTGLEYPLAAMLLHIGEYDAALTMLADIRDRHDGTRRSPWNEIECGDHYARAMASWTLLEEAAGLSYDATQAHLRCVPRLTVDGTLDSFFITASGWGGISLNHTGAVVTLDYGSLLLDALSLPSSAAVQSVTHDSEELSVSVEETVDSTTLRFGHPVLLHPGSPLCVAFR